MGQLVRKRGESADNACFWGGDYDQKIRINSLSLNSGQLLGGRYERVVVYAAIVDGLHGERSFYINGCGTA